MKSSLPLPFLLLVLLGACSTDIRDVRLEGVRPAARAAIPTRVVESDPPRLDGVVVDFSSAHDLRHHVARFSDTVGADRERCRGRTHIDDRPAGDERLAGSGVWDSFGFLIDAGRPNPRNPAASAPIAGVRVDGRYLFSIHLPLVVNVVDSASFAVRGQHDLRRDLDDLCVFVSGARMFVGNRWRTNTIVIPNQLIQNALERTAEAVPHSGVSPPTPDSRPPSVSPSPVLR